MVPEEDSLEKIGDEDLTLPKATLDKLINDALISKMKTMKKVEDPSKEDHNQIDQTLFTKETEVKVKKRKQKKKSKKEVAKDLVNTEGEIDNSITKDTTEVVQVPTPNQERKFTIARDVKELIMKSALEFVHLITAEANEICEKDNKKTITHEHILESLKSLGYNFYIDSCKEAYEDHVRISQKRPGRTNKFRDSGLTLDQLHEEQKALFDSAKQAFVVIKEEEAIIQKENNKEEK